MKTTVKKLSDSRVEIKVTLDAKDLKPAKEKASGNEKQAQTVQDPILEVRDLKKYFPIKGGLFNRIYPLELSVMDGGQQGHAFGIGFIVFHIAGYVVLLDLQSIAQGFLSLLMKTVRCKSGDA